MKGTIEVPEEGLKLITIVGFVNGNPIWREVGRLIVNSKGNPKVLLDRTFNLAGPVIDDSSIYINCSVKEFSKEEIDRRAIRKRDHRLKPADYPDTKATSPSAGWDDMDDDIPF